MTWRLIWLLAPIGLLMGILGLFGLTGRIESLYWTASGLFAAYVIGRIVPDKPFQHGLIVGLTWITAALIKVTLWQTYINFNPTFVSTYEAAGGLDRARLFMLAGSPVIAAVMGVVIGFFAWVSFRLFHTPSPHR